MLQAGDSLGVFSIRGVLLPGVGLHELDVVIVAHDFAATLSLQVHLLDVPAFIVEEAVRVPEPGHSAEKYTKHGESQSNFSE